MNPSHAPLEPSTAPRVPAIDPDAARVYQYWFGRRALDASRVDPYADSYRLDHALWFRAGDEVAAELRARFGGLMDRAARGDLDAWRERPREAVCLAVVLSSFSRIAHRGTAAAHACDARAAALARDALARGYARELAPAEALQLALALMRSEDVSDATAALDALTADLSRCARGQQRVVRSWREACLKHLDALKRFGRDPLRNAALGRASTDAELRFVARPEFAALFGARAANRARAPRETAVAADPSTPRLRILALHGLRQSGEVFRARARKLRRALADIAEVTFVTAPHSVAAGEGRGRAWWTPSPDGRAYEGLEVSLAFVDAAARAQGPFDGVLGFSQGGALAALLVAMQPREATAFRFAVCISAFDARAAGCEALMRPGSIAVPSLHVLADRDAMVPNARSRALFEAFDPSTARLTTHPGSHFAPGSWPLAEVRAFVEGFLHLARPLDPRPAEGDVDPLRATALAATCAEPFDLAHASAVVREAAAQHRWSTLTLMATQNCERLTADDCARPDDSPRVGLDGAVVEAYAAQLRADLRAAARFEAAKGDAADPRRARLLGLLAAAPLGDGGDVDPWPSLCAREAPRVGASRRARGELAKRVAAELFPPDEMLAFVRDADARDDGPAAPATAHVRRRGPRSLDEASQARRLAYQRYTQLLSVLNGVIAETDPAHARERDRRVLAARAYDPAVLAERLARPLARAVTEPEPEPVVPCHLDDLAPLFAHLSDDAPVERQTAFARGTLTPDGRLDLCKQVVGPEGIRPLLGAMRFTSRVKRLLLGNNIVGDGGAEAIAEFLRARRDSPLECWYIAGNHIGPAGIRHVCEALAHDDRVTSLWLKRNPLKPEGATHVAGLLRANRRLEVLDLVNCGLLDEGFETLLDALTGPSRNTTLRHLYVGTNGITARSAAALARYLATACTLESLSISCNRLGDEGVEAIAPALARTRTLRRLSLASNRIGPRGARALAEALADNTSIELLDLGFTKSTLAVGEVGNLLGDEGACAVADLIARNRTIRSLDLLHNDISQVGVNAIRASLRANTALLSLQLTQFGRTHNEAGRDELRDALARNRAALDDAARDAHAKLELPDHIAEIYSVYRTHL